MALSVQGMADRIAADLSIGDYDLWHMRRRLEDELFRRRRRREPLPIDLIYGRRVIMAVEARRRAPRH